MQFRNVYLLNACCVVMQSLKLAGRDCVTTTLIFIHSYLHIYNRIWFFCRMFGNASECNNLQITIIPAQAIMQIVTNMSCI